MRTIDQSIASEQADNREADEYTLTFGLTDVQYVRLRRFITSHENETGERLTYQAVAEAALAQYLNEDDQPLS